MNTERRGSAPESRLFLLTGLFDFDTVALPRGVATRLKEDLRMISGESRPACRRRTARWFLALPIALAIASPAMAIQENPPEGAAVADLSGIQVFSGWKCDPGVITMSLDNKETLVMGSGTSRVDTASFCQNDGFNGYGLLYNVNLLGDGEHIARFFDDGKQFAEAKFKVVTLDGKEFVTGATGTAEVRDFPAPGQGVSLEWVQGLQGFQITGFCEGDDCPTIPDPETPCPADMEQIADFCINKTVLRRCSLPNPLGICLPPGFFEDRVLEYSDAVEACSNQGKRICSLEQLDTCQTLSSASAEAGSCRKRFSDLVSDSIWTSSIGEHLATNSLFLITINRVIYNDAGGAVLTIPNGRYSGAADAPKTNKAYCCKAAR